MAGKRLGINVDVQFESKQNVSKKLRDVLNQVEKDGKLKIQFDTTEALKSFNDLSNALDKISKQFKSFGNKELLGKNMEYKSSSQTLQKDINHVNDLKKVYEQLFVQLEQNDKLGNKIGNLNEKSQIRAKKDLDNWSKKQADSINKNFDDTYKKSLELEKIQTKLMNLMNTSKSNSFIDPSVFSSLQARINNINTDTAEREIIALQNAIHNLGSTDSNIVRLQNTILGLQNRMESMKGKYGGLVGDSSSIKELKEYEARISSLQTLLSQSKSGINIDGKKISNEINQANASFKTLETSVKNSSQALRLAQKDAVTFSGAIKDVATKVGVFTLVYSSIAMLKRSIRSGVESVIELDRAMTTLSITMQGMTDSSLANFTKRIQSLATDLSSTTSSVLEAVTTFANMSETLDSIMSKTSSAIILSNLTGLDTKSTVDTIQSATQQFKDLADGSAESAMKVTDSMVAISKAMGVDFTVGVREMSESLKIVGSLSDTVGMDIDETLAIIGAGAEKLRLSGTEVATAMKSVMSRMYRTKDGETTSEELLKTEKALKSIGIEVYDQQGGIRSFTTVMQELNEKWDTMSDKQKMFIADSLGGMRQVSQVLATVQNMDRIDELTGLGRGSDGAGLQAQAIWAESLDAKLQKLTNSVQIFWQNFINSDLLANGIDLLTGLVNVLTGVQDMFGSLGTTIGVLTTAFLLLTDNPLKRFIKMLFEEKAILTVVKGELSAFTTAVKANGIASATSSTMSNLLSVGFTKAGISALVASAKVMLLTTALTMGLGFALTAIVGGISTFIDNTINAEEHLREFNDEITQSTVSMSEATSSAESLYGKIKSLQQEIANTNDLARRTELEQELVSTQENLAKVMPETANGLSSNNQLIANSNTLIEAQIQLKKDQMRLDAISFFEENKGLSNITEKYKTLTEKYEKMRVAQAQGKNYFTDKQLNYELFTATGRKEYFDVKLKFNTDDITEVNKEMQELGVLTSQAQIHMQQLSDADIMSMGIPIDEIDDFRKYLEEANEKARELNDQNVDNLNDSIKDATDSVKELSGAFDETTKKIDLLNKMKSDFSEYGKLSVSTVSNILNSGDMNLIAMLENQDTLLANINSELERQEQLRKESYDSAIESANAFIKGEEGKAKASTKTTETEIKNNAVATTTNAKNYETDVKNKYNAEATKAQAQVGGINSGIKIVSDMVGTNSDNYKRDVKNWETATNEKIRMNNEFANQMNLRFGEIAKAKQDLDTVLGNNPHKDNPLFNANKSGYVGSNYVGLGGNYNNVGYGDIGGNSSGGSGGSKEQQEYQAKLEQWYKLNEAIERNNEALSLNKIRLEQASGTEVNAIYLERIRLLEKQRDLTKQLEQEQRKTLESLRNQIKQKGGVFDGDTISNYESLLGGKVVGDGAVANRKELENLINEFEKLKDTIGDTSKEWREYDVELKKIYKEQADIIASTEQDITKAIENELKKRNEAQQKALDKQRKMIEEAYESEDKEDNLRSMEDNLSSLKAEMRKYENDLSASGQAKLSELQKQYAESLKEYNDQLKENQKDTTLGEIEKESEKLEEELENALSPENLTAMVEQAMKTGMVTIGNEVIKVTDLYSDMVKDNVVGTQSMTNEINEYINSLKEAQSLYQNFGSINSNLGNEFINTGRISTQGVGNTSTVNNNDFKIEVKVEGTNSSPTDIAKAVRTEVQKILK